MMPLAIATGYVMQRMGYSLTPPVVMEDPISQMPLEMAAATMFLVGIWEETFFRYLIMDCLMEKFMELNKYIAIILSSALFGYAHVANLGFPYSMPQAIAAGGAGLWFAYIYKKQGLHMAIMTHALYNFSVVLLQRYPF